MSKDHDDFLDWFKNSSQKLDREKAMEQSGIPLEMRVMRQLRTLEYNVGRTYYHDDTDEQKSSRELDFLATKRIRTCQLPTGEIDFRLYLLGECKRSSDHDFFAFEAEQIQNLLSISDFPIRFHREALPPLHQTMGSLVNSYHFPFVTDRIVEVNAANYKTREKDNYGDKMTHEACEKLFSASIYFMEIIQKQWDFERTRIFSSVQSYYATIAKNMPSASPHELASKLVEDCSRDSFNNFGFWPLAFGVPMFVLDNNRGLVKTLLRNDGSVEFGSDMDVVLYPYFPEHLQRFRRLGAYLTFPVIVCKQESLPKAVKAIEDGTNSLIEKLEASLKKSPTMILEQILVSQIEGQKKSEPF